MNNIATLLSLADNARNEALSTAGVPVASLNAAVAEAQAETLKQVTKDAAEGLLFLNDLADSKIVVATDAIASALKQISAQQALISQLSTAKQFAAQVDAGPLTILVAPHLATGLPESRKKVPEGWTYQTATPVAAA